MRIGIIGLPASGKTTLYRLLTRDQPGRPGARPGEPSIAIVRLPDPRLDRLAMLFKPKRTTPATIEIVDLPPIVKGSGAAASGASQPLALIRQADALLAVLRAFEDERVAHPEGTVDPARDAALIEAELLLADLDLVEKRIARIEEGRRKGRRDDTERELALLERCRQALGAERPLRAVAFRPEEARLLRGFQFLTAKPLFFVLNAGDDPGAASAMLEAQAKPGERPRRGVMTLAVKLELELAELPPDDASALRSELGLTGRSVGNLLQEIREHVGVITFFTVVGEELRAWLLAKGATALQAAATVHSDMERGFIRAEVVPCDALIRCGSMAVARREGALRLEGRDYIVTDGDVITIRFGV
jgi:hypothetical protein